MTVIKTLLTLSVLMSIKVDVRGRVLKSTKVDVKVLSAVTEVYVDRSRHSFVELCSKVCIYICHGL